MLLTAPVLTCTTIEGHTVDFKKDETGVWIATITEALLPNNSYGNW